MPVRIAPGPFDDLRGLKSLLSAEPSAIEEGFRVLEIDVPTGDAGTIDLVGVDRSGTLTLLALAPDDPDPALLRLLDQCRWARAERHLLARAYREAGAPAEGGFRFLLLAPSFTPRFVARLPLLAVEIAPCLVRRLESRFEVRLLIEPAAPLHGFAAAGGRAWPREETEPAGERPWVQSSRAEIPRAAAPLAEAPRAAGSRFETTRIEAARPEDTGLDDLPALPEPPEFDLLADLPPPLPVEDDPPVESLTPEELEEFERFDLQRRGRDRGAS